MPPRTGPRRRKRVKQAPAALRHFAILACDDDTPGALGGLVIAHSVELDDGHLVLRDEAGTIIRIIAKGEWREIRPLTTAEKPALSTFANPTPGEALRAFEAATESREQATLVNQNDPVIPPGPEALDRYGPAVRAEELLERVPSSPEEAQRILREVQRRLSPESSPDAPPPALPRKE